MRSRRRSRGSSSIVSSIYVSSSFWRSDFEAPPLHSSSSIFSFPSSPPPDPGTGCPLRSPLLLLLLVGCLLLPLQVSRPVFLHLYTRLPWFPKSPWHLIRLSFTRNSSILRCWNYWPSPPGSLAPLHLLLGTSGKLSPLQPWVVLVPSLCTWTRW